MKLDNNAIEEYSFKSYKELSNFLGSYFKNHDPEGFSAKIGYLAPESVWVLILFKYRSCD